MSSCAISAGLDFRPACPGMGAERLAIETLLMLFHKGPHSEAPVPSGKSGGVYLIVRPVGGVMHDRTPIKM